MTPKEFHGACRTNYFEVTDGPKLQKIARLVNATIKEHNGAFALIGRDGDHEMVHRTWDRDEKIELHELLAPILAKDSICVVVSGALHVDCQYVEAKSYAFNHKGECVNVNLNQIYRLAEQKFGTRPNIAEW